jgi:hypothetical protein
MREADGKRRMQAAARIQRMMLSQSKVKEAFNRWMRLSGAKEIDMSKMRAF